MLPFAVQAISCDGGPGAHPTGFRIRYGLTFAGRRRRVVTHTRAARPDRTKETPMSIAGFLCDIEAEAAFDSRLQRRREYADGTRTGLRVGKLYRLGKMGGAVSSA